MEDIIHPAPPKSLVPFSNQFVCPSCGAGDVGAYCSECGKSLQLTREQVFPMLVNRLRTVGYRQLDELGTEEAGEEHSIYQHFDYTPLQIPGTTLLVLPFLGQNGMCLDVLIASEAGALDDEAINGAIEAFWEHNQDRLVHQQESTRKPKQMLEKVSVRYLLFMHQRSDSSAADELLALRGRRKIKVRKGKTRLLTLQRRRAFKAHLDWSISVVDLSHAQVLERCRRPYDAVGHEAVMSVCQARKWEPAQAKKAPIYQRLVRAVFEGLGDYFVILFQFLGNRYLFAELIVHKQYIGVEKILVYYLVGIGVSVTLPMALTFGALTPGDLLTFADLPPIVDETAELLVATAWIALEAVALHLGLRVLSHRGNLKLLFMSLFFVYAFFQVFDRPFEYLISGPVLRHTADTSEYLRLVNQLGNLRWFLFAYFVFPFIYAVYRAGPKVTATAYVAVAVAFIAVPTALTGGAIFQPNYLNQVRFDQVVEQEKRILDEFNQKVVPLAKEGDRTGDYSTALSSLEPVIQNLENLTGEVGRLAEQLKGEDAHPQVLLLQHYISARRDVMVAYRGLMRGEVDQERFQETVAAVDEASEAYNRGLKYRDWPRVYLLAKEEDVMLSDYKRTVIPLLEEGDQSGDYTPALAALEPIEARFDELVRRAFEVAENIDDREMQALAIMLGRYLTARHDALSAVGRWIREEIPKKELDAALSAVQTAREMYAKASSYPTRAQLYPLTYDEWRTKSDYDAQIAPRLAAKSAHRDATLHGQLKDFTRRFGELRSGTAALSASDDPETRAVAHAMDEYLAARVRMLECLSGTAGSGASCAKVPQLFTKAEQRYRALLKPLLER